MDRVEDKPKGLCIATRCTSVDELVAKFHAFCDETSIFVTTVATRAVGVESQFVMLLADKTPVLRGWCIVFDAWTDTSNPFGRPGLRLGLHRLTPPSQALFDRLLAARAAAAIAEGRPVRSMTTQPIAVEMTAPPRKVPTVQIPVLAQAVALDAPTERTPPPAASEHPPPPRAASEPMTGRLADGSAKIARPREETRTPGSDYVLPANPLMNLTDASLEGFVDCRLYEELTPVPTEAPRAPAIVEPPRPPPPPPDDRPAMIVESPHVPAHVVPVLPPPVETSPPVVPVLPPPVETSPPGVLPQTIAQPPTRWWIAIATASAIMVAIAVALALSDGFTW